MLEYVKTAPLVDALWHFIENVSDETPDRTEIFFALRERVRAHNRPAPLMPKWCVTMEVRAYGAIGKFQPQEFLVRAATKQAAFEQTFAVAREKNLETRFGLKAERYEGE